MRKAIRQRRRWRGKRRVDPGCSTAAIEDDDLDARVAELLDGISGAYERAQAGLRQGLAGDTIRLDDV
jgi:hypothetical protein